ncbi:MAG: hypothetical protein NZM42_06970 [Gemmatales bacterium]|nr:hypothetical protein [Gemmatales bacterium]
MGSAKRLLGMVAGLAACLVLYQVYVFFLGGYDGLAPLPAEYWPGYTHAPSVPGRDLPNLEPPVVRKLRQAFGPQAKEAERPIVIESVQHGVILAAQKVFLSREGKLELEQVAVAIFGKKRSEPQAVEISTIQGDRAVIEFDKPLTSVRDVANRKPVAGRIEGRIDPATGKTYPVHLRHNRRTANPDDDLHLYTDWLQYDDRQHRIWTEATVEIVDSDPGTAKVTGLGLEVLLEAEPAAKPGAKPNRLSITGVRSVELSRNVQMYFQLETGAALLGGKTAPHAQDQGINGAPTSSAGRAAHESARSHKDRKVSSSVKVLADGPFVYRVPEERAEFHHRVHLMRILNEEKPGASLPVDELRCQSLTLQFRRQRREKIPSGEDTEAGFELVAARATGELVEVMLESENLQASGTELVIDRMSHSATLVGRPLEAVYDGHRLQVLGTLILRAPENQVRELRDAQTRGPGTVWLRGRQAQQVALVARWREQMQLQREGSLERLLLTGNVLLEEPQRGSLRADHLLLWLEANPAKTPSHDSEANKPSKPGPAATGKTALAAAESASEKAARGRIPRCLEASGNVSLQSETLVVPYAERLRIELHQETSESDPDATKTERASANSTVLSSSVPIRPDTASSPPGTEQVVPIPSHPDPEVRKTSPSGNGPDKNGPPSASEGNSGLRAQRPPLVLRARTIEAVAAGTPAQAELRVVSAHGQVQIDQPTSSPQDRALQVRCGLLRLTRTMHGDILRLEGTPAQPASVQFGTLALRGPVIKLDQVLNTIDVEGLGSMRLPSRNDFQGNPLREPVEVVVDWNQSMFFDGRLAEFDGGVQAVQGNSRLACRRLSLLLNRKVSLREQKTADLKRQEPPAALSRLMCEQNVRLEKVVMEGERYRLLQRIEARELAYDHELATLTAYGPGTVIVFQPANAGPQLDPSPLPIAAEPRLGDPPLPQGKPEASPFKLTRIQYDGFLQATKAADKQTDVVTFAGGVQLVHVSADDPDAALPVEQLPEDALNLSCGQLKITSRKLNNNNAAQELLAEHGVRVRARQFHALADRVSFDEAKDLLILEGANGATLYRQRVLGGDFEPVRAKRIWFWRRDNRVRFDGTESIHLNP